MRSNEASPHHSRLPGDPIQRPPFPSEPAVFSDAVLAGLGGAFAPATARRYARNLTPPIASGPFLLGRVTNYVKSGLPAALGLGCWPADLRGKMDPVFLRALVRRAKLMGDCAIELERGDAVARRDVPPSQRHHKTRVPRPFPRSRLLESSPRCRENPAKRVLAWGPQLGPWPKRAIPLCTSALSTAPIVSPQRNFSRAATAPTTFPPTLGHASQTFVLPGKTWGAC